MSNVPEEGWANSFGDRPEMTDAGIQTVIDVLKSMVNYRLSQKGRGIYVSSHECLGVITEEYKELIDAVQSNDTEQFDKELIDVAVACIFSLVSLDTGKMHWC